MSGGVGQYGAFYDSGHGIFDSCDHIRRAGNDRKVSGRYRGCATDRLYRNLPGTSHGMDFSGCISDSGFFLLQKENCWAVSGERRPSKMRKF